ncbi:MAG TPA: DNA alkylation repair protein [Spirochaetota bacterium]|jgi:3-methyladenine DNA glycosylase AlkD|nr:MAG: DNA alkylation repair enzyme [Spirochaetes bacterium ADurb.Bin133]HNZ25693.1 DNA alkylation repair protein [Spirochaetota bacterium]HPY86657.1 DNA alkylation repair protein [Spirochaetota bacterium]HQB61297.1 DNA alkylation repair protein [Spirochaetota bacterium]
MIEIIIKIRRELSESALESVRESSRRFFKENIKSYGVKAATVKKIGSENFKLLKNLEKIEIFKLCEEMWRSGFLEETFIASEWSYRLRRDYKPEDFKTFERWVGAYINNWASCDTFCNHSIGAFIESYPAYLSELKKWATSSNRWVRRASAVSLIVPAKKGMFLNEILEISDILLLDNEDMVQKGYGWMLKVASATHEQDVFNYVLKNKSRMPRTALRYAIEKMPKELKIKAMER